MELSLERALRYWDAERRAAFLHELAVAMCHTDRHFVVCELWLAWNRLDVFEMRSISSLLAHPLCALVSFLCFPPFSLA